jgi:hypothetical protein
VTSDITVGGYRSKKLFVSRLFVAPLGVSAQTVSKNGVQFDRVADHCYSIAETKSREAADWVAVQRIEEPMGAGFFRGVERKRLRKNLH